MIDLKLLEHRLDIALSEETKETLNKYINEKRMNNYKPDHYSDNDPFKIMEDNCTFEEIMGAVKLNIIKYALRTKGQDKEDLEKIIAYANWGLKQYK